MGVKSLFKCLVGVFGIGAVLWLNKKYENYKKEELEKIIANEWMDSPDTDYKT